MEGRAKERPRGQGREGQGSGGPWGTERGSRSGFEAPEARDRPQGSVPSQLPTMQTSTLISRVAVGKFYGLVHAIESLRVLVCVSTSLGLSPSVLVPLYILFNTYLSSTDYVKGMDSVLNICSQ